MMPPLHVERTGSGPDLVLVHGWGLHGGVWTVLVDRLAPRFRLTVVDLPGHGRSPAPTAGFTLAGLAEALLSAAPGSAAWLGWSLGALAVLAVARRRPAAVTQQLLVAATPRFVASADWPDAVAPEVFAGFARDLAEDSDGALRRFINLQFAEGAAEHAGRRVLRAQLHRYGTPHYQALRAGLDILQTADLRSALPAISVPTMVMHGTADRLAAPAAGQYLARFLPQAHWHPIPGAGHAPFVSQPEPFAIAVEEFLHG
jgi:pimeloyl-[acyl-carrier protein] methyl ester esterase